MDELTRAPREVLSEGRDGPATLRRGLASGEPKPTLSYCRKGVWTSNPSIDDALRSRIQNASGIPRTTAVRVLTRGLDGLAPRLTTEGWSEWRRLRVSLSFRTLTHLFDRCAWCVPSRYRVRCVVRRLHEAYRRVLRVIHSNKGLLLVRGAQCWQFD